MTYRFKALPELYWSVITAGATVLLLALVSFDPTTVTDWQTWIVALGSGILRSMAGAALDYMRRSMIEDEPEPEMSLADEILSLSPAERLALTEDIERRAAEARP